MAIRSLTALVVAMALAAPASGAKWVNGCPPYKPIRLRPTGSPGPAPYGAGAMSYYRYFEHVGHEFTLHLRDTAALNGGGFSTEPGGNTVEVTFLPVGYPTRATAIPLPPVSVTATSPTALTIVVPDTRPILGRLVVGPAKLVVKRDGHELFTVKKFFILPPMNDVHALLDGSADAVFVYGAMDKGARVWIPFEFSAFGQGEILPECPTILTPVTAFAVEFNLKKGDDQSLPYVSFGNLKKNWLFLGDYLLFGQNLYGNKLSTKLDVTPLGLKGIVLCGRNDALQLVVMIGLRNPALGDKSTLTALVRDGSPISVKIEDISLDPQVASVLQRVDHDSANLPCYPAE